MNSNIHLLIVQAVIMSDLCALVFDQWFLRTAADILFHLPYCYLVMLNQKTAVCISASKSGRMHGSGSTGMPDQQLHGGMLICLC
jgi:hypothetical protein